MIRALFVAAGIAAATVGAAPLASATPTDQPVPNMSNDAVLGEACYHTVRYIFGYDASGNVLSCGGPGKPGIWVDAGTLIGVREIGSDCVGEIHDLAPDGSGPFTAQSPEGVSLYCSYPTDTWEVRPTR
jgi:hypothetical protein